MDITDYLIESSELLVLPDVYFTIKEAIDDPHSDLAEIARLAGNDPAISARILSAANSPIYGLINGVDSLTRAVNVLGTKTVHDLVLASCIAQTFSGLSQVNYQVETFWLDSLLRGCIAHACANELNISDTSHYFTIGLLSDIGHMVMSIRQPQLMQRVFQQHQKTGHPLHLYERSTFGFDYGELGGTVLQNWGLPETIVLPVRFQNCPELCPEMKMAAAIIYSAGHLSPIESSFPSIVDIETLHACGITHLDAEAIREQAAQLFEEATSTFSLNRFKQAV